MDMHLSGLEAMGAVFEVRPDCIVGRCDRLRGAEIEFGFPSVGATENILTAAVLADGTTVIKNAAREPEIVDLCAMLRRMGARIDGEGTPTITVRGVEPGSLGSARHEVVTDRVQAATYIAAVGMCGGQVRIERAVAEHMGVMLGRFTDMGLEIDTDEAGLTATCHRRLTSIDVATLPVPGVATDDKPLVVAMLSVADGTGIVTENLYPGRFRYVEELRKLGADITIDGHHAVVRGVEHLTGARVDAPDIRAGAAPWWPGSQPAASPRSARSTTSTAATTTSWVVSPDSVHRSVGSRRRVERCVPGRLGVDRRGPAQALGALVRQPQEPHDQCDRAGREEELVPATLVGDQRRVHATSVGPAGRTRRSVSFRA
ncbi:MAG: UDP-N-acetylglucosamine 1-carboxyvinyltransferase [Actinomycetota bacterium]